MIAQELQECRYLRIRRQMHRLAASGAHQKENPFEQRHVVTADAQAAELQRVSQIPKEGSVLLLFCFVHGRHGRKDRFGNGGWHVPPVSDVFARGADGPDEDGLRNHVFRKAGAAVTGGRVCRRRARRAAGLVFNAHWIALNDRRGTFHETMKSPLDFVHTMVREAVQFANLRQPPLLLIHGLQKGSRRFGRSGHGDYGTT
mmetsp:Transcript_20832/g.31807  ORF Transcript_20832/g.31807 Transcript_20832/m.31807 type:complete len:201 (-) Transcript_20832:323-925(-)